MMAMAKPAYLAISLAPPDKPPLAESLSHGIGYYHEALSKNDKRIVESLFEGGAIKVLLASRDVAWELKATAHMVIKDYYRKFLNEALPIESHLPAYLHDAFVTEISTKTIGSTQDAVDWSTYTYFYRRLLANPSYYSLTDISHEGLSTHLSEMVENTLKDLAEAKIVDVDEEDDTVTPLNAAMIAAYYNISFITMQTFLLSLTGKTKLKGILEIVTSATEFESIQIRRHEDRVLRRIYDSVPVKMSQPNYESPHFKAFVLLQAHFSRMQLPADLTTDQAVVLGKILNLLSACVDVLSSEGHLNAMSAMEMSQMCVQAMWDRDSALMQIPFFTPERVKAAGELGIKTIFDFMDAMGEDSTRTRLLQRTSITESQLGKIAHFTNKKYPNIDLAYELEDPDSVVAARTRRGRRESRVHAPFYPQNKIENWWIVVGEESSKALLAIKRVTIGRRLDVRLDYTVPNPGRHELKLFLMSDSYVGVDLEEDFEVEAAEGMDEDGDEEDDDE
ncbi:unnamed protein product [Tuber melanosporum]|uniref:(Perigord truffle) hypothetical protein n=1 Tax=Tuber melanosporum (strain Mel28) TaxID=656061 RepID=D5GME2_TUBMM|nr:uncharacterized protein GSTUM_00010669001 [Tuber melanosporum]CAZ85685.1 unnamed protein product [Tuber melanosporum]